jgi:hypothetical protein
MEGRKVTEIIERLVGQVVDERAKDEEEFLNLQINSGLFLR